MPETKIRNATKLCLATPGNDHQNQAKDIVATAPCTPDKFLTSEQGTLSLSPITPIPVVVTTGIRSRRPSPIVTTGRHASNDDTASQEDRITLVTAEDYSTEQSPTECPAFDPASLADFITEHRSTTVKKFHGNTAKENLAHLGFSISAQRSATIFFLFLPNLTQKHFNSSRDHSAT